MKKIELKPITKNEYEKLYGQRKKKTSAAGKIVDQFCAWTAPVAEVIDYPNKTPGACANALRKAIDDRGLTGKVRVSQRKDRIFLLKVQEETASE